MNVVFVAHPEVPTMLRISARGFYLPDEVFCFFHFHLFLRFIAFASSSM